MSDEQPLENVGYFKDDLIIAFKSRPISKNKNILTTDRCKLYIKEPEGYRLIGLVQDLHVTAGSKDVMANVSVSFPKNAFRLKAIDPTSGKQTSVSAMITKNKKDLTALGVTVK
jgi:hypothetical protein